MAEPVKFKISTTVAAFVRPGVSAVQKLSGLDNAVSLMPMDRLTLVYCLLKDADGTVKQAAQAVFADLPENVILSYIDSSEAHPSVLDALAKVHNSSPWVAQALLGCPLLSGPARTFLQGKAVAAPEISPAQPVPEPEITAEEPLPEAAAEDSEDEPPTETDSAESCETDDMAEEEAAEVNEEEAEFQSKYKIAMVLGISEKIKMALTGDKEWRSILIKDANKLVSGSVIKNPRITDGEILTILKVGVQNDEIIRLICANKEWVKNYMIRKALVDCPKTPLPNALRYLASLNEKDIAGYAKSKNISSVLSTQAKRMLLAKKR